MRSNKPTAIGDILAVLKKESKLGKQLEQALIWERWPELAGPHLSAHGRPYTVKENKLVIQADSTVWMHKFAFRKWDIIKRINRMVGHELVSDIFVSLSPDDDPIPPQDGG